MPTARTDKRRVEANPAPEAEAFVDCQVAGYLERTAALARSLAEVERQRSYLLLENAELVGRVFADEAMKNQGIDEEEWLGHAENTPARQLRDLVNHAIEKARQQEIMVKLNLVVTRSARDGFQRARSLIRRKRRKYVTEGETFAHLVEKFLENNDPLRKPLANRPKGAGTAKGSRYISQRVKDEIRQRSRDMCEFRCLREATDFAHLTPHAKGGGREAKDLVHSCRPCHTLFDAGYYEVLGFDEDDRLKLSIHPEVFVQERPPPYDASRGPRSRPDRTPTQRAPPLQSRRPRSARRPCRGSREKNSSKKPTTSNDGRFLRPASTRSARRPTG